MKEEMISTQILKEILLNKPDLLAKINAAKRMLPESPAVPDGKPKDFIEAMSTPGACAIPVWSGSQYRFFCIIDGESIQNSETGEFACFDSYSEAMEFLDEYMRFLESSTY